MTPKLSSERGAILIQVAVASIVLIAFSMFVVDYGVMWVSRGQAQNAADSGALAGAIALAFDDFDNRADDGPAKVAAQQFALRNKVFGEDPDVKVASDIIFYDDDPTKFPAVCADDTCIRVDVYRTDRTTDGIVRSNPLPMWFGQLVGLNTQGVRATATAQIFAGNASECVKPWVIADRWSEGTPSPPAAVWDQTSHYSLVTDGEPDPDDATYWDTYVPPSVDDDGNFVAGTGFGAADDNGVLVDYGYQFILRMANPGGGSTLGIRSPGWVMTINLPADANTGTGTSADLDVIRDCTTALVAVADPDDPCDEPSSDLPDEDGQIIMTCLGVSPGNAWNPQEGALEEWIGPDDIDDEWLADGEGDCMNAKGCPSNSSSKRIIPLALFDPAHYAASGATGSTGVVKVVNILGFFIEGTCGGGTPIDSATFVKEPYLDCSDSGPANDLIGRLVTIPGVHVEGAGTVGPASFTKVIRLIR